MIKLKIPIAIVQPHLSPKQKDVYSLLKSHSRVHFLYRFISETIHLFSCWHHSVDKTAKSKLYDQVLVFIFIVDDVNDSQKLPGSFFKSRSQYTEFLLENVINQSVSLFCCLQFLHDGPKF